MPRSDNYPDDMRQYDDDPRSPEFTGPDEEMEIEYDPNDDGDYAYDCWKDKQMEKEH